MEYTIQYPLPTARHNCDTHNIIFTDSYSNILTGIKQTSRLSKFWLIFTKMQHYI